MKKFVAALLAGTFLFGFGIQVFAADPDRLRIVPGEETGTVRPGVEVPEAPRYTCPPTPYINCMPPVEKSGRKWCDPEYLQWAKGHCPGLRVLH
jgi:hypothetical protein